MTTGRKRPGMAIDAASAARSGRRRKRCFLAPVQIGRHHGQRNGERGKIRRHGFGQELRAEFLGIQLRRLTEAAGKEVGEAYRRVRS